MPLRIGSLMIGTTLVLNLVGCKPGDVASTAPGTGAAVEATVNGAPITTSRVDLMVRQKAEHGQSGNAELRKGVVDQLAMQWLLSQEAVKAGLDKSSELADQIALAQQSLLAKAYVKSYFDSHPVSDEMLKAEYERVKTQMAGVEYKARQIVVGSEAEARTIIAKLNRTPKAFETMAKELSMDMTSRSKGGDLGWFDARNINAEVAAVLPGLKKAQINPEPIKSPNGFHIILLEDLRQKQPPAFEQTKAMLRQQVQQQNLKKMLEELKANAKIEMVSTKPKDAGH